MKVDLIRKFKWYIVGFMLVAIMLSASLSFCAWDTLSAKVVLSSGKSGGFEFKWNNYLNGANGERLSEVPSVGDIVTFGRFYQDNDAVTTGETAPQRWIVVDNDNNKLALLTEQVVVYGNYWGNGHLSDYYRSTVRSWLNSGKGSLQGSGRTWKDNERYNDNTRNDNVGSTFGIGQANQVNRGFLDVAFTADEKKLLVPKQISGMRYVINPNHTIGNCTTNGDSPNKQVINDLVWLPSYYEIYGTAQGYYNPIDGIGYGSSAQFSYFADNNDSKRIAGATGYAWNASSSSYYNNGSDGSKNGSKSAAWWWLRSPYDYYSALVVYEGGGCVTNGTYGSVIGVRPAVYVQL